MNTTPLPAALVGPASSQGGARAKTQANAQDDAPKFTEHLQREVSGRQKPEVEEAARPQASPIVKMAGQPRPEKAGTPDADGATAPDAAASADQAARDAAALSANPMADLMNLVASFNQPVTTAAAATVVSEDPAAGVAPLRTPLPEQFMTPALAAKLTEVVQGQEQDPALAGFELPDAVGLQTAQQQASVTALPLAGAGKLVIDRAALTQAERALAMPVGRSPETAAMASVRARAADSMMLPSDRAAPVAMERAAAGAVERDQLQGAGTPQRAPAFAAVMESVRSEPAPQAVLRPQDAATDMAMLKDAEPAAPVTAPLQQAALGVANAAAASDKIPARVGTPGWDNQVAQKIVWMVAGEEQSATLTLNPPDMGPMQVVLSVTNDHANVTFSSATPEVRQALEDALPKLREMMSESGISLGDANVNDGSAQQRQAQEDAVRQRSGGSGNGGIGNGRGERDDAVVPEPVRPARRGGVPGMVDTFA